MNTVLRVGDVIERVFDPTVPELLISREDLRRVSWGRDGARIEALLREVPVGSVRAPIVAALLTYIGVEALAPLLRSLSLDDGVPPLTRGIASFLLLRHRVSPQVAREQVPELAQSLLLGTSLLGSIDEFGPVLTHWLTRPGVDGEAILARIEPWRIAAAADDRAVYGPALVSAACGHLHASIRAGCSSVAPTGVRAWASGQTVWALFGGRDGYLAAVCAERAEALSADVSPLLDATRADELVRRLEGRAQPAPLDALDALLDPNSADRGVQRARWLLARARSTVRDPVSDPSAAAAGDPRSGPP